MYEDKQRNKENEGLLIIMEGWMPPLLDFLSYLSKLRQTIGPRLIIYLALTGRPEDEKLTTLSNNHLQLWKRKTGAIGDPYLQIFPLRCEENSP